MLIRIFELINPFKQETMNSISVSELKEMMDNNEDFHLIDVREAHEYEAANINATLIPLSEIAGRHGEFPKDKKVIVHCRSGKRSADAIAFLSQNLGYTNLVNLEGGIMAWARDIDNSLEVN